MNQIVINIIDTHNNYATVEKFTQSGAPVLSYTGDENRFASIMSSKFSFNILNETAEDGRYLDLLTGEERRFLIEVCEVLDFPTLQPYPIIWRGFLLPDVYGEPYENNAFFVNFTATDGLDVLKTKPFLFYKTSSVMSYIAKCLYETGLHQEIYFAPGIENAFYDWQSIQLFEECFTKYSENTDTYQYSSCYDVLLKLLDAVGATLFQHNGKWFISGYNRRDKQLESYKVYNCFGNYLRNEQRVRAVKSPKFNTGVFINMASPYKTVQFNVVYQEGKDAVDLNQFVKNNEISADDYMLHRQNLTTGSIDPFNQWRKSGATRVTAEPEDGGTYLRLSVEGNNTLHDPDEVPVFYQKAPYCVTMFKVYGPPHNFEKDYIEIKPENALYVSPQVIGKELQLDIDIDLKILSRANEEKYNADFYRQAFRLDILIGDDVVFSTRSDSNAYNSDDTKITFEKAQTGPKYFWYAFPDYTKAVYVLDRFTIPAVLKAEIKRKALKTNKYGKLNVRVYIPRNGDDTFGFDDFHVSQVTVTNLDIKVKAWDKEEFQLNREIRYTTKFDRSLDFNDGKNDLYVNLFKINDRNDYPASVNEITLFSGAKTQDSLYYYFAIPGIYGDYVEDRYSTLKLYSGSTWHFAHKLLGRLCSESGIEFIANRIRISKARIDEFPEIRSFLNDITKITVAQTILKPAVVLGDSDVPREKYISWKRFGSAETGRYLSAYAKMIHECTAVTAVKLEATALDIITPMDIIDFHFMNQKRFIPTSVLIDFSGGKTKMSLTEAINQNVIDYANA